MTGDTGGNLLLRCYLHLWRIDKCVQNEHLMKTMQ
jgi:hypothetical protein